MKVEINLEDLSKEEIINFLQRGLIERIERKKAEIKEQEGILNDDIRDIITLVKRAKTPLSFRRICKELDIPKGSLGAITRRLKKNTDVVIYKEKAKYFVKPI